MSYSQFISDKKTGTINHPFDKKWKGSNNRPQNMVNHVANYPFYPKYRPRIPMYSKGSGIIPYTLINGTIYFLLQQIDNKTYKKNIGWNDFGGKRDTESETASEIAAREFSEETSCLFYLKEQNNDLSKVNFELLKNNDSLEYDENALNILRNMISQSTIYFKDKIDKYISPIYLCSRDATYVSYFLKVEFIPENDIPKAEDIHLNYLDKYRRTCKWFSISELLRIDENNFHKRLQVTKIKQKIMKYQSENLFT
uniref:Nudix hydrolase domain-containing protein n=1 Tax=viral metagenome TaxID=1070528 RepID=A0A6C0LU79_9ZZZZ